MMIFSDNAKASNTEAVLEAMEDIDDDCDVHGVPFKCIIPNHWKVP